MSEHLDSVKPITQDELDFQVVENAECLGTKCRICRYSYAWLKSKINITEFREKLKRIGHTCDPCYTKKRSAA